jgi:hypothetical protein
MTLTVVDNADGTGAVATIAGSAGGNNTVYAQPITGTIGSGTFAAVGTRVGDGTVPLALAKGYWFAYCLTAPATLSGLAYFAVTDGMDAVPDRVFQAAKAQLQLLALPFTTRVYDFNEIEDPSVTYPCTLISTQDGRQSNEMALNGRDDWGWPVRVLIRDVVAKFDQDQRSKFRLWREKVTRAFVNQRMPGLVESVICRVEPGALLRRVPGGSIPNVVESELVIRAIAREVRGLGA